MHLLTRLIHYSQSTSLFSTPARPERARHTTSGPYSRLSALFLLLTIPQASAQFLQQAKLVATPNTPPSTQGDAVALSGDGSTLALGGSSDNNTNGGVWVYTRVNGAWTQQSTRLSGSDATSSVARTGFSVALSADGNTLIEGAPNDGADNLTGAAWIFVRSGNTWTQQGLKLAGSNGGGANQGSSVAISADGNTVIVGGPSDSNDLGAAWIFTRSGTTWTQQAQLVGSNSAGSVVAQGLSVALSGDGNTALVGGPDDNNKAGAVWIFTRSGNNWTQQGGKLAGNDAANPAANGTQQGFAAALSFDGNTAAWGGPGDNQATGATWIFTRTGGAWTQQGNKLVGNTPAAGALQGFGVALSSDGNEVLTGGPGDGFVSGANSTGAAWVFRRAGTTWTQFGNKLAGSGGIVGVIPGTNTPNGPQQGISVALSADGNTAAAGGPGDNSDLGAVWVFAQTHFAVSAPGSATSGTAFTFTVTAQDANNNTLSGYSGTLHFTSTDGAATVPGNTAISGGTGSFQATLRTNGAQTITATDASDSGVTGRSGSISVTGGSSAPATHFSVTAPSTATANSAINVTVMALDATNSLVPGYSGTIHFTTTDGAAILPGDTTLSGGAGQFQATLKTAGGQTITVADKANRSIAGTSGTITVSSLSGGGPTVTYLKLEAGHCGNDPTCGTFTPATFGDPAQTPVIYDTSTNPNTRMIGVSVPPETSPLLNNGRAVNLTVNSPSTTYDTYYDVYTFDQVDRLTVMWSDGSQDVTYFNTQVSRSNTAPTPWPYIKGSTNLALSFDNVFGNRVCETMAGGCPTTILVLTITPHSSAPAATHFNVAAPSSANSGASFNVTVTAQDASNATVAGYTGTVHLTSTDSSATLAADATLSNGVGTFPVTLKTAGSQTVTATDKSNSSIAGTSGGITVSSGAGGGNTFVQQGGKFNGSNANSSAGFVHQGNSVAISADGNTAVVGAPGDNGGFLSGVGAVYVFTRSGGVWTQQGPKLIGNGASGNGLAQQGTSVAISADGNTIVEGGNQDSGGTGAAWVFTRTNGVWTQQGNKLVGSNTSGIAFQGISVAISGDGKTILVGGEADNNETGAVWVFTLNNGTWTQQGDKLVGMGATSSTGTGFAEQGASVALSFDGNTALIGGFMDANVTGATWVFTRNNGVWTQQGNKLVGNGSANQSYQGVSVSLSSDGNTALIGGFQDNSTAGAVWVFTRSGSTWTQQGNKLSGAGNTGNAQQGVSVSLSADGNTAVWGGNYDNNMGGAVWVFTRSAGAWTQLGSKLVGAPVIGTVSLQGGSVSLSGDGNTLVEGGIGDNSDFGAVWFFARPASTGGTATHFSVSAPSTATAGSQVTFTVTAQDAGNNTATGYTGTVHFTSTDSGAALPADSALTSGVGNFFATLHTAGTQTITATDKSNSSITGTSGSIVVSQGSTGGGGAFGQQSTKLFGSDAQPTNKVLENFGFSAAISADGNTAAVGADLDGNGTGTSPGAVFVFTRNNGAWTQQGPKLVPFNNVGNPDMGVSVALSADGNTLISGGVFDNQLTGAAFVYSRSNGVWTQQAKLVGTPVLQGDSAQGWGVSISADGNTALLGGDTDNGSIGETWVFTRTNGTWTQQAKLVGSGNIGNSQQGHATALSGDGNTAIVGGFSDNAEAGAAWIFTRNGNTWTQQTKLVGNNAIGAATQGDSVALSFDGNTALVGGLQDNNGIGAVWVFTRSGNTWTQQAKLVGAGSVGTFVGHGASVSLSGDGNTAMWGAPYDNNYAGAIWVFTRSNGQWTQSGSKLVASCAAASQKQGNAVAMSADAGTFIETGVGAGLGGAWVFSRGATGTASGTHFTVTAPSSAVVLSPVSFMVSAVDACSNPVTSYSGTVHFTSSDSAATLPADSTLSSGAATLPATFRTQGFQTITATDTAASSITGTSNPVVVAGLITPIPVSVSPAGGNASTQQYTFVFSDPRGYQDMHVLNIIFNRFIDGTHGCFLAYVPAQNLLVLVDDAGDAGGPYAGNVTLGNVNPISNSQCSVVLNSATGSGNTFTLVLTITWNSGFAGDKIIFMAGRDPSDNSSGWYPLGVARVPGGTQTISTAVVSTAPFRVFGSSPTQFAFTFSDNKGMTDIGVINVLINSALDGRHGCYLAFSRPGNVMFIVNDTGTALLPGQSMAATGSISNSQCVVTWGANPVTTSGNSLTLTLTIAFTNLFNGNRVVYTATRDVNEANNTDWHAQATFGVAAIQGSVDTSKTARNLTTEAGQFGDWSHWGDTQTLTGVFRAAGGSQMDHNLTQVGQSLSQYSNDGRALVWSDGSPTASSNGATTGLSASGFSFNTTADTFTRTLTVHVGGSMGTIRAHLSDAPSDQSTDYIDVAPAASPDGSTSDRNYTLIYNAGSPNQTLTITWTATSPSGTVNISGAAVSLGGVLNSTQPNQ